MPTKSTVQFTAKQFRHAADLADRTVGRMLNAANDCEEQHTAERADYRRKAQKARREAAEFRRLADLADLD